MSNEASDIVRSAVRVRVTGELVVGSHVFVCDLRAHAILVPMTCKLMPRVYCVVKCESAKSAICGVGSHGMRIHSGFPRFLSAICTHYWFPWHAVWSRIFLASWHASVLRSAVSVLMTFIAASLVPFAPYKANCCIRNPLYLLCQSCDVHVQTSFQFFRLLHFEIRIMHIKVKVYKFLLKGAACSGFILSPP